VTEFLSVEVVLATPQCQQLVALAVAPGTTVAEAIEASGVAARFPEFETARMPVGIWGRCVARDTVVADGDRVELYRPLQIDPRDARRQLARAGLTMRGQVDR